MPAATRLALVAAAVVALVQASAPAARAGSLGVSPTRVDLAADRRAGMVTLQNNAAEPVLVQIQTFAWPAGVGSAELQPTRELVAVPAVAEIAPGGRQLVRVALRGLPRADAETAYRLLVTEVPPGLPGTRAGVRFALRLSLPVFVTPPGALPAPAWSLEGQGRGLRLALTNRGGAHVQVRRLRVFAAGAAEPVQVIEEAAYVLPGQRQTWALAPAAAAARRLSLKADTDIGEIEAALDTPGG